MVRQQIRFDLINNVDYNKRLYTFDKCKHVYRSIIFGSKDVNFKDPYYTISVDNNVINGINKLMGLYDVLGAVHFEKIYRLFIQAKFNDAFQLMSFNY